MVPALVARCVPSRWLESAWVITYPVAPTAAGGAATDSACVMELGVLPPIAPLFWECRPSGTGSRGASPEFSLKAPSMSRAHAAEIRLAVRFLASCGGLACWFVPGSPRPCAGRRWTLRRLRSCGATPRTGHVPAWVVRGSPVGSHPPNGREPLASPRAALPLELYRSQCGQTRKREGSRTESVLPPASPDSPTPIVKC